MSKQQITVNACANAPLVSISGGINRENGENITAMVRLLNPNDSINAIESSNYQFSEVPVGGSYRIKPERNNDVSNGVTTFDIALISKHVLDIQSFTSPYQMIAADVNRDGQIGAVDMLLIRNLVLKRITRFPNNTAWRFIPKNFVFSDNKNPFAEDFPENNISTDINKADFVAVKVGDVNLSAKANLNSISVRNEKPIEKLGFEDRRLEVGEEYIFNLNSQNAHLIALQMALKWDKTKVAALSIEKGNLPQLDKSNIEVNISKGSAALAWAKLNQEVLSAENTVLTLKIKVHKSAWLHELISLDSQFMDNMAYDTEGVESNVELYFKTNSVDAPKFELYQNFPNPFRDETVISFVLPEEGKAELVITDFSGKEILVSNQHFNKGYNEVYIPKDALKTSGIYLYRLKTDKNMAQKRLIYVK